MKRSPLSSPVILAVLAFWFSDGSVRAQPNYNPPVPSPDFGTPEATTRITANVQPLDVVCVMAGSMAVEAAVLSKDTITIYTHPEKYEYTSICIKDWITLANSCHADRFVQPANVRMVSVRR